LEWRLFVDRIQPLEVLMDILWSIDCLDEVGRIAPLRLLGWCAYFHGSHMHLGVVEEMLNAGCQLRDGSLLHLALLDCATANRPLWPELALMIENVYESGFDLRGRNTNFPKRFVERFRVLYPQGLIIYAGPRSARAEYRILCRELQHGLCRIDVLDAIEGTPLRSALDAVASPITKGPQLDSAKIRQIEADTSRVEKFFESRVVAEPEAPPHPVPPQGKISKDLDPKALEALREIIQRPQWPASEFNGLAKVHGMMPLALQDRLNAWCLDNFDELLLEGESPVAFNKQLSEKLRIYYDENN